jgi:nucleotide-binding universal stress UspA family protein
MFTTIVWATDGSLSADRALPYAKALAEGENARLVVVHADEHFVCPVSPHQVPADEDDIEAKIHDQVEEARTEGLDASVRIVAATAAGAAHAIADVARQVGADAIVVGTRGYSLVAELLAGGVPQRLLYIAPCPVLVVPSVRAGAVEVAEDELPELAHG